MGQHSTIQINTTLGNTINYDAIKHNKIKYHTIPYNTIQCNLIQHNTAQCLLYIPVFFLTSLFLFYSPILSTFSSSRSIPLSLFSFFHPCPALPCPALPCLALPCFHLLYCIQPFSIPFNAILFYPIFYYLSLANLILFTFFLLSHF